MIFRIFGKEELKKLFAIMASGNKIIGHVELLAQMLVRSYDPCISCSVH